MLFRSSAKCLCLIQLLILLFAPSALAVVKRQSNLNENDEAVAAIVGDESPAVGFGGTDPPASSLNEPIAAIGTDQGDDGKGLADIAYDTVEEQQQQQQSSMPSSSTNTAPPPAPVSENTISSAVPLQQRNDAETTPTTTDATPIAQMGTEGDAMAVEQVVMQQDQQQQERNPSNSDRSKEEEEEETTTVPTTASSSTRRTPVAKKKDFAGGAKERKGHKTAQAGPTATADDGTAVPLNGDGDAPQQQQQTVTPVISPNTVEQAQQQQQQQQQRNCNSERIRALIIENIHAKPSVAKRQIQSKVAEQINGKIDVICARHAFSYIVNSELFCEAEHNGVICLCFKQQ